MMVETAMGVLPGATGSRRLPRLLGRQRALEVLLEETHAANHTLVSGEAQRHMKTFLAMGAQTEQFERHELATALDKLQSG